MSRLKNEIGNVYGHLTVTEFSHKHFGRYYWKCLCDCGNETIVDGNHLRTNHTTSCGCRKNTRHGYCYTPEYQSWCSMLQRCNNPRARVYKDYGGRGITICNRWLKFKNFIADMGEKPSPDLSIERIDNNGNYEPNNCRWATQKEQLRNRRNNHIIEYNGQKKCMIEWCEETGLSLCVLASRIQRGWSTERALTTPCKSRKSITTTPKFSDRTLP